MKKRKINQNRGPVASLGIGIVASALILVLSAFVAAVLSSLTKDPTGVLSLYALIALLISSAISGITVTRICGKVGISALTSLAFALIMMIWGLISNGGSLPAACLMNCGCYLGVGVLSAFIARPRAKRHK